MFLHIFLLLEIILVGFFDCLWGEHSIISNGSHGVLIGGSVGGDNFDLRTRYIIDGAIIDVIIGLSGLGWL